MGNVTDYIWNSVSDLSFTINKEFLDYLNETQMINLYNGWLTFNLDCNVEQLLYGYKEIVTTQIIVRNDSDSETHCPSHAVSCHQNQFELALLTTLLYAMFLYFNEI